MTQVRVLKMRDQDRPIETCNQCNVVVLQELRVSGAF